MYPGAWSKPVTTTCEFFCPSDRLVDLFKTSYSTCRLDSTRLLQQSKISLLATSRHFYFQSWTRIQEWSRNGMIYKCKSRAVSSSFTSKTEADSWSILRIWKLLSSNLTHRIIHTSTVHSYIEHRSYMSKKWILFLVFLFFVSYARLTVAKINAE